MPISGKLASLGNSAGRPRILVIMLRRIGDVLLTTPLIASLRARWPQSQIDALVFRGSDGILAGNPDLSAIIAIPEKASPLDTLRLAARLWRDYDLAISTQTGDRPTAFAWIAGRARIGLVRPDDKLGWLKHRLLHGRVAADLGVHRIVEGGRLLEAAGVSLVPDLVPPRGDVPSGTIPAQRYAVLHPNPKFAYKRWNAEGWRKLAARLAGNGLAVFVTGGPDAAERAYLDGLWPVPAAVTRMDGKLDWPQLAALMASAAVYVGTDTSMTHLAAASGCPTVALYGPVDPRIMGPWPTGGLVAAPWQAAGTVQQRGHVWLVQNPAACPFHTLPCEKLGCDGHLDSRAQCLDEMTAEQVWLAVEQALAGQHRSTAPPGARPA